MVRLYSSFLRLSPLFPHPFLQLPISSHSINAFSYSSVCNLIHSAYHPMSLSWPISLNLATEEGCKNGKRQRERGGRWWLGRATPPDIPPRWNVGAISTDIPNILQWCQGAGEGREEGSWASTGTMQLALLHGPGGTAWSLLQLDMLLCPGLCRSCKPLGEMPRLVDPGKQV
jgi:hypothetical protein